MSNVSREELQHVVGNKIFALETNLEVLRKRTGDTHKEIMDAMQASLEGLKKFIKTPDEGDPLCKK